MALSKRDRGDAATRSERKAKRRKAEDRIPDLPGEGREDDGAEEEAVVLPREKERGMKRGREEEGGGELSVVTKKPRTSQGGASAEGEDAVGKAKGEAIIEGEKKKSKKERKVERKVERRALRAAGAEMGLAAAAATTENVEGMKAEETKETITIAGKPGEKMKGSKKNDARKKKKEEAGEKTTSVEDPTEGHEESGKAPRFIVFVGNLPFTATRASILAHFAKVAPKDVRNLTERANPSKSRGIAFVEFAAYDRMKTCLKLMHHSEFDDGKSAPRKINVELTAGGGGKTKARSDKIKAKNHKLQEERFRAVQETTTAKAKTADKKPVDKAPTDANMHPSRRRHLGLMA